MPASHRVFRTPAEYSRAALYNVGMMGQTLSALDTPQAILDLDVIDANVRSLLSAAREREVAVRVHFKSLKSGGLAKYLVEQGVKSFLAAKVNEAEVLADAGVWDILIANQIVGEKKIARVVELARRTNVHVLVDCVEQVTPLADAARDAGVNIGALIEVDIGMNRCGVPPGEPVLELAKQIKESGLRFDGLQGYDGHLQLHEDAKQKRLLCHQGLKLLSKSRELLENEGIDVGIVTGGGTGTWEYVAGYPGVTEIQPGSFVLMDAAYHAVRSEFACALSILTTVISRREGWFVLDAGSKAISKDFGDPVVLDRPDEKVARLSEEHARIDSTAVVEIGDRRRIVPTHCCATMNLHRQCVAIRKGVVEAVWLIEASGRYD